MPRSSRRGRASGPIDMAPARARNAETRAGFDRGYDPRLARRAGVSIRNGGR